MVTGDGTQSNQVKDLNKTSIVLGQAQQLHSESKQNDENPKNAKSIVSYIRNIYTKEDYLKALSTVPAGSLVINISGSADDNSIISPGNKVLVKGKWITNPEFRVNYSELMPIINKNLLTFRDLGHTFFQSSASNNGGLSDIQPINQITIAQDIVKAIEEYVDTPTLNSKIKSAASSVIGKF